MSVSWWKRLSSSVLTPDFILVVLFPTFVLGQGRFWKGKDRKSNVVYYTEYPYIVFLYEWNESLTVLILRCNLLRGDFFYFTVSFWMVESVIWRGLNPWSVFLKSVKWWIYRFYFRWSLSGVTKCFSKISGKIIVCVDSEWSIRSYQRFYFILWFACSFLVFSFY